MKESSDSCTLSLSRCDTVAQLLGRWKGTAIKALEAGHSLSKLGEFNVCIDEVVAEATGFIAVCYGSKERNSMCDVRKDMWATKMGKPKVTIIIY